jgi:hypothetical protein
MTENKKEIRKRKRSAPYSSVCHTTGDIELNINRFNQAFGTAEGNEIGMSGDGALTEAKRYVRRYYFRPMNVFASNKAEIIKTLIDIGEQNCTIYTLNNLGDDKDVSKLSNRDIIYTYDNGILKDKNGVRIMDYDLSIKKEEERKKFANVEQASDKEFKAEYEDRMTDVTELEESLVDAFNDCDYDVIDADYTEHGEIIVSLNHNVADIEAAAEQLIHCLEEQGIQILDWNTNGSNVFIFMPDVENAFDLDFEDVNVFGERLTEAKERLCCICGEPIEGSGHVTDDGVCCDGCQLHFSIGG